MPCPDILVTPPPPSLPPHSRQFVLICASGEILGRWIGYKLLIRSDVLTQHYHSAINLWQHVCVCMGAWGLHVLNPVLIVSCWLEVTFSQALGECPGLLTHLYFCLPLSLPPSPPTLSLKLEIYPAHRSICIVFPLLQRFLMCIVVGELRAMPAPFHFSDWSWCVSLSLSFSVSPSLFLLLCVILANQYRDRNTMIVFSPNIPLLQFPLCQSANGEERRDL